MDSDHHLVDLRTVIRDLIQKKWLIICIALSFSLLVLSYAYFKPKQYQASLLLQIQQKSASHFASLKSTPYQMNEPISAQIALIKSKFILTPLIHDLALDIDIKTPMFSSWFGDNKHDALVISSLTVPPNFIDKKLHLIAGKAHDYSLYNGRHLLLTGKVGELNRNKNIAIKVDSLNAKAETQFVVVKKSEIETINRLLSRLKVLNLSNANDNSDNKLGLLQISFVGKEPQDVMRVINKIADMTQQKNRERKINLAEKQYIFLNQQLPLVKESLVTAENALNQYRLKTKKMDINLARHNLMTQLADIDKELQELRIQKMTLLQQYTEHYPEVILITNKLQDLKRSRIYVYNALKKLPKSDENVMQLTRDIKIKSHLYMSLLNQIHQLDVEKSGIMSDITLLDVSETPDVSIRLNFIFLAFVSFIVGIILGSIGIFITKLFLRQLSLPQH